MSLKVLAIDLSTCLYNGQITPWTGRIKKFNKYDILKIVVENVLLIWNLVYLIKQGHSSLYFNPVTPYP